MDADRNVKKVDGEIIGTLLDDGVTVYDEETNDVIGYINYKGEVRTAEDHIQYKMNAYENIQTPLYTKLQQTTSSFWSQLLGVSVSVFNIENSPGFHESRHTFLQSLDDIGDDIDEEDEEEQKAPTISVTDEDFFMYEIVDFSSDPGFSRTSHTGKLAYGLNLDSGYLVTDDTDVPNGTLILRENKVSSSLSFSVPREDLHFLEDEHTIGVPIDTVITFKEDVLPEITPILTEDDITSMIQDFYSFPEFDRRLRDITPFVKMPINPSEKTMEVTYMAETMPQNEDDIKFNSIVQQKKKLAVMRPDNDYLYGLLDRVQEVDNDELIAKLVSVDISTQNSVFVEATTIVGLLGVPEFILANGVTFTTYVRIPGTGANVTVEPFESFYPTQSKAIVPKHDAKHVRLREGTVQVDMRAVGTYGELFEGAPILLNDNQISLMRRFCLINIETDVQYQIKYRGLATHAFQQNYLEGHFSNTKTPPPLLDDLHRVSIQSTPNITNETKRAVVFEIPINSIPTEYHAREVVNVTKFLNDELLPALPTYYDYNVYNTESSKMLFGYILFAKTNLARTTPK